MDGGECVSDLDRRAPVRGETLGDPRAALFSFAVAVLAYNTYCVVRASLRVAHGAEAIEERLSDYHLMDDVAATYVGMDIAVPEECWEPYRALPANGFAKAMVKLAHRVQLARYPKKKRGPKKPRPKRKSGRRNHHISTARLLLKRGRKAP